MTIPRDDRPAVLEARGVSKVFPGTVALNDVDVALRPGRVHALIGENGAGKSTLVKILAGIEQPTTGRLLLNAEDIRFESARDASTRGVGIIHQELQLFPDLSVAENLFVGRERRTRWGTVDRASQQQAATDVLARLGQTIAPRTLVGTLPLGQQQIVEIARALVYDTRVLMMDEPTSALTASEIPTLFRLIRDLASHGVAIVYISHRLEELLQIADEVTVLRDGANVGHSDVAAIGVPWIVERMTGRSGLERRLPVAAPARGATRLSVKHVRLEPRPGRSAVDDVSFDLHAGEILGMYGLMGAGRTELLESLLGVYPDAAGEVRLDGAPIDTLDVGDRVAAGLAIVPEDRKASGFVATMSVCENMTLSSLTRLSARGYLSPARESEETARLTGDLRVKAAGPHAPITSLSGGNQQKVVIARGVMSRPKVLLMDEPTRGVDVAAKAEILETMRRLAGEGMGVMFASSDLREVLASSTRILVMARGRITAEFEAASATADALASAASAGHADLPGGADAGG